MRASRYSGVALARRQLASSPAASVALFLLVLLVALVATATPRAMENLFTAGLQRQVENLAPSARDLSAVELGGPLVGAPAGDGGTAMDPTTEAVLGRQLEVLRSIRESMPDALRRSVVDPRFTIAYDAAYAPSGTSFDNVVEGNVFVTLDPWLTSHVRMVEGALPAPPAEDWPGAQQPLDLVLSAAAAEELGWSIGDQRTLQAPGGGPTTVQLSGTFEAVDTDDDFWQQVPDGLEPSAVFRGLGAKVVRATAFVAADGWQHLARWEPTPRLHVWYPLRPETMTAASAPEFSSALREFTREQHANSPGGTTGLIDGFGAYRAPGDPVVEVQAFSLRSNVSATLDRELARSTVTTSVVAMAAAGPLGVVIAVLSLSVSLLLTRRRTSVAIAAARGASRRRLRLTLAVEGLVLGLPAAVLGAVAAVLLVPGHIVASTLALPAVVGLAPAALLASRLPADARQRSDLDSRAPSRIRAIAELLAVVLATAGVVLLMQRGIASGAPVAFDPLLIVTPLLLTLAACVVVLRVYPIPLALIARRASRGTGLVPSLGAARGLRDQTAGLAPVLAMVVAVSITTFSAVLLSTTTGGIDDAAADTVGGDVSLVVEGDLDTLRGSVDATPGVVASAAVWADDERFVEVGNREIDAGVIAADTAELATVQERLRGGIRSPVDLDKRSDGAIPAIVSTTLLDALDGATEMIVRGETLRVVGSAPDENPFVSRQTWVLVDSAFQKDLLGGVSPHLLLASISDDSAVPLLAEIAPVTSSAEVAREMRENPAIYGLVYALALAIALSAVLCAAAVALTLVLGASSRARVLAVLRALGGTRRLERGVLAWEIAPTAIVALVTGTALGIALPSVVLAGVDLRQFTGGATQPDILLDPVVPTVVAAGFLVIVLLATATALLLSRSRTSRDGMENHD